MENSPIIVAIDAERVRLQHRLVALDELERAARAYVGAPASVETRTAPKPRKPKAKPGELELALLEQLSGGAELTSSELQRRTGRTQAPVDAALRRLFGAGKAHHDDGNPRKWSRVPSVAANGNGAPAPLAASVVPPSDEVTATYLERRLLAELQRGPASPADAAAAVDADEADVAAACERLLEAGEVSRMEDGRFVG